MKIHQTVTSAIATVLLLAAVSACTSAPPSVTAVPEMPAMESGAREASLQLNRERAASVFTGQFPDKPLPEADLERAVAPSEWAAATAECMTDAGFPSRVEGLQVDTDPFPEAQVLAQASAVYTCRVKYPIDPSYQQPYSAEETEYLYSYYTNTLVPCLEAERLTVEDVPSLGVFKDGLGRGVEWNPFDELRVSSNEQWAELESTCPQKPSGFRGN